MPFGQRSLVMIRIIIISQNPTLKLLVPYQRRFSYGTSQYRSSGSLISTYPLFTFTIPVFIGLHIQKIFLKETRQIRSITTSGLCAKHINPSVTFGISHLRKMTVGRKSHLFTPLPCPTVIIGSIDRRKIGKPASMRRSPIINVHDMDTIRFPGTNGTRGDGSLVYLRIRLTACTYLKRLTIGIKQH